jgi:UDP-3-O-[3-hydroxymyristoyl] glucosamine N-acyltransferase
LDPGRVKIDNLVQIGHNVVIGKHSIIVAQVGIAGSVRIGSGVVIGGQAGIIGHIEIDDGTMIGAQSGVSKSLHGGTWWATPTSR